MDLEGSIRVSEGGLFMVFKSLGKLKHGKISEEFYEIRYLDDGSKHKFSLPFIKKCNEATEEDLKKFKQDQVKESAYEKTEHFKINGF